MSYSSGKPGKTILAMREATASAHQALNDHGLLNQLVRPDLTYPAYAGILEAFYGFYAPVEREVLSGHREVLRGLGLDRRERTPLLRQDLGTVGYGDGEIDRLTLSDDLPSVTSPVQMLGCVYVLDGAALGGRVISRRVLRTLGVEAKAGLAFFTSNGTDVAGNWRRLMSLIEANTGREADRQEAVGSAAATFACFERWFDRVEQRQAA